MTRIVLAVAVLAAAPLAGVASAKCQPETAAFCAAYYTACDVLDPVKASDKVCDVQM